MGYQENDRENVLAVDATLSTGIGGVADTLDRSAHLVKAKKATKVRWMLLGVIWITCLVAYLDRVNMSVAAPLIMKQYGFDKVALGMLMSAFFLAYMLMQIPGGMLSERFGVRKVGTGAVVWWSIFTALTPLAIGFWSFMAIRFLFGVGEGPLFPNNGSFIAKWMSSKEKSMSSGIVISGAYLGPAVGPPLTVWIMTTLNWQTVFYLYAIIGLIIGIVWYALSRDLPEDHPSVNKEETEHIHEKTLAEIEAAKTAKHEVAPWKKFLCSGRFWALGLQYFGVCYVMYVFLSWLPVYLLEARGLSLKAMGFAAAYPWLAICFTLIFGGKISDWMVAKGFSKFKARTIPAIVGLLVSGISFYKAAGATSVNENVFWLTMCLGFTGFTFTATWTVCQDMGGKFGGALVSWIQTWANGAGFVAPTSTALLVKYFGWETTLIITSLLILSGVVFWFFVKPDKPLVEAN